MAGEIGKPHGISGEVYVRPLSDDPQRFSRGSRLDHASGRALVVEGSRRHRDRLLVKFEGVETRNDAEELRGEIFVTPGDLRVLEEDEYWEHDLVGCEVVDVGGDSLGRATGVTPGPAQDLLRVETDRGETLVPLVDEIVESIDPTNKRIVVDPPAGLF